MIYIEKLKRVENTFLRFLNRKLSPAMVIDDHDRLPLRGAFGTHFSRSGRLFLDVIFIRNLIDGSFDNSHPSSLLIILRFHLSVIILRATSNISPFEAYIIKGLFTAVDTVGCFV